MKAVLFAGVLSLGVLALFLVATLPDDEEPFQMHGIRMNHARYHSGDDETFTLEVVMDDASKAYGYEAAMTAHHIVGGEGDSEALPLELESLTRSPSEDGIRLHLEYALPLKTEKTHFHYDPARLRITYSGSRTATIPIGTFSYHFDDGSALSSHLDYERITVMSEPTPAGAVATGACITFVLKDGKVVIEGMDTGTPALRGNMDYLTHHSETVTPFTPIESVLGGPFNPKAPSVNPKTATLSGDSEETLCVPFTRENTLKSERFPFIITYSHDKKRHTLFIDDVRYIRNTTVAFDEEAARATLEED